MIKSIVLCLSLLISGLLSAQIEDYRYMREISEVEEQWHRLKLVPEVLSKLSDGMHDIKVIGITSENDTIEAAYLLRSTSDKIENVELRFSLVNQSYKDGKYYYTLKNTGSETINLIDLGFKEANFSYTAKLEGSQDQEEWYEIIDKQLLVSIKNDLTNYHFCKLSFPASDYSFYRIQISSEEDPGLIYAKTFHKQKEAGSSVSYEPEWFNMLDEEQKKTELIIDLDSPQPIHEISLELADTFDYYRPVEISYLADSFETEKGWKYNYRSVYQGTLSSLEKASFEFSPQKAQRFKVRIENGPNPALDFSSVKAKAYKYYLLIRFTEEADYYLAYGKDNAQRVEYEIAQFQDQIPEELQDLSLANEIQLTSDPEDKKALFENELWLWLILGSTILILARFSFKMVVSKQ